MTITTIKDTATSWRSIEIVTAAFLGVTFGVVYWGWSAAYTPISEPFKWFSGGAVGLLGGPWLIAGVVGALVVRRPGAALIAELLAAAVEALLGNEWGWTTLISGGLQGLGVELAFALFLYRRYSLPVAALGGIMAALFEFGYEINQYWQAMGSGFLTSYAICFAVSGAVVAGVGGYLLSQALASTGAIDSLKGGHDSARQRAV